MSQPFTIVLGLLVIDQICRYAARRFPAVRLTAAETGSARQLEVSGA